MLRFDEILGQPTAVKLLKGLRESDRVPHALLFHGPEGLGKATTAETFSAALLCERPDDAPCGSCSSCRLLVRGNHPDYLRVGRLTRDEGQKHKSRLMSDKPDAPPGDLAAQIFVDQIRLVNRLVGLRPRLAGRRILVIDPAERMGREAQNALLKTLEEPPEHSALILISSRPHLLLPTVRSRCFSVGFSALRAAELVRILESRGYDSSEAGSRASLSGGCLGTALKLELESRLERRRMVHEMLTALAAGPGGIERLSEMAAVLAGKNEATLQDSLDMCQDLLRDASRAASVRNDDALMHPDLKKSLTQLGRSLGPERAAELVKTIEQLRSNLRVNANRNLTAEALLAAVAGGPLP